MAWLTEIMEVLFAGAMLSLASDLGKKYYGLYRPYVVGSVAATTLLVALGEFLSNWSQVIQGSILLQPIKSIFSTLYSVDRLGVLVILTILVVGIAVVVYCTTSFSPRTSSGPFFTLLILLVLSSIGVVSSGDFLTLFLFWTGLSVGAYGLVSFERRDISLEAAMKYFFLAGAGSLIYLYGVALVYSVEGSIRLSSLSVLIQQNSIVALFAVVMIFVGLGVEAAIFPFHTWLPDAYGSGPPFVGALNGRLVDEVLLFAMLKIVQPLIPPGVSSSLVHGIQIVLVGFAVMTMFVGNFGAMGQGNLRRMLAFSSIAQIGYMLAAIATFTPLGLLAATFQIWNHGLVKSNFFMLTGIGRGNYEETDFEKMKGIGRQKKFLGVLYAASSLAMVGSPPFGMFWSELLIVQSLLSVGSSLFFGLGVTVVFNVFLSIAYYFRIINTIVLNPSDASQPDIHPYPASILSPVFLLGLSLVTGILPAIVLGIVG
jgi:formate hydrogenlyase subunit 3/multisubunit Na+/H+ antiporter MnhD subunit